MGSQSSAACCSLSTSGGGGRGSAGAPAVSSLVFHWAERLGHRNDRGYGIASIARIRTLGTHSPYTGLRHGPRPSWTAKLRHRVDKTRSEGGDNEAIGNCSQPCRCSCGGNPCSVAGFFCGLACTGVCDGRRYVRGGWADSSCTFPGDPVGNSGNTKGGSSETGPGKSEPNEEEVICTGVNNKPRRCP